MKKKIPSINSKGPVSRTLENIFKILLRPYIEATYEQGKSQAAILDELFHTETRAFFHMKAIKPFNLPGVKIQGSRKIPGSPLGREIEIGDYVVFRRDQELQRIDVSKLDYESKEDQVFEISLAEMKYIMDRCEYV